MIISLGTDICAVSRIAKLELRYGTKFLGKIYTLKERERIAGKTLMARRQRMSGIFATKEAMTKALGRGIGLGVPSGVHWRDIEVLADKYGKPYIVCHNNAEGRLREILQEHHIDNNFHIHVSISHEREYAISTVIVSA